MKSARLAEAISAAAAGAALGGAVGSRLSGLGLPLAVVAGANGAISGWRHIRWTSAGVGAFVLDSTWATSPPPPLVAGGHGAAQLGYSVVLSERQNRHVYARLQLRKGFATTFGNVVAGARDLSRAQGQARHRSRTCMHEARFGPAYPPCTRLVGGRSRRRLPWSGRRSSDERLSKVVESCAYYLNPFSGGHTAATTTGRRAASSTAWGGSNRRCSRSPLARRRGLTDSASPSS